MLFAMLQDQHDKQIMAMEATNKANMEAMMEWMNALVAARGNKENTPPTGANATARNNCGKAKKYHCSNCKKMGVVQANVGQKLLKCDMLRVFQSTNFFFSHYFSLKQF
jgi:hypothetical protein